MSARDFFRGRFADNLTRARKRSGLTREELARRAGIDSRLLGRLEDGDRSPLLETALRLADSLERPLDSLVLDIEWRPAEQVTRAGEYVRPCRRR